MGVADNQSKEEWRNAYEAVAVPDAVRRVGEEIQAAFGRDVRFVTPGDHDNVKAMIDAHNGPIFVRRVKTDMPVAQFFGLFKRFSVSLSSHGMLDGRDYTKGSLMNKLGIRCFGRIPVLQATCRE